MVSDSHSRPRGRRVPPPPCTTPPAADHSIDHTHPQAQAALRAGIASARRRGLPTLSFGEWLHAPRCPARGSGDVAVCRCTPRVAMRELTVAEAEALLITEVRS